MAENKKSILFYVDWGDIFDQLPNDKAGELIKHLCDYVRDKNPTTDDLLINAVFAPIKSTLKRDLDKWLLKSQKNSENAKKRWNANASERIKTNANNADSVTVSDTVTVTDSDTVTDKEVKIKVYSQAIQDSYKRILNEFPIHLQPKDEKIKKNWLDTLEKLERIDGVPLQEVEKIVRLARQDDFWAKNFISLTKLRKKNPDNLPYIVVLNEKLKQNGQTNNQETATERAKRIFKEKYRQ